MRSGNSRRSSRCVFEKELNDITALFIVSYRFLIDMERIQRLSRVQKIATARNNDAYINGPREQSATTITIPICLIRDQAATAIETTTTATTTNITLRRRHQNHS